MAGSQNMVPFPRFVKLNKPITSAIIVTRDDYNRDMYVVSCLKVMHNEDRF